LSRLKLARSTPVTVSRKPVCLIRIPVAATMWGCLPINGRNFALKVPAVLMMELPGARTTTSAPTPRDRRCCSSSMPVLKPTRVSTMVT